MKKCLVLCLFAATACAKNAEVPARTVAVNDNTEGRSSDGENATTRIAIEKSITQTCGVEAPHTYFEFDSAEVAASDAELGRIADCLASGPLKGRNVRVVGSADKRGTEQYNKALGKSRAEAVASYLETKGVAPSKIITKSRGSDLARGTDEGGYAFDRRVDIGLAD